MLVATCCIFQNGVKFFHASDFLQFFLCRSFRRTILATLQKLLRLDKLKIFPCWLVFGSMLRPVHFHGDGHKIMVLLGRFFRTIAAKTGIVLDWFSSCQSEILVFSAPVFQLFLHVFVQLLNTLSVNRSWLKAYLTPVNLSLVKLKVGLDRSSFEVMQGSTFNAGVVRTGKQEYLLVGPVTNSAILRPGLLTTVKRFLLGLHEIDL